MKKILNLVLILSVFLVFGCNKDETINDYAKKSEKIYKNYKTLYIFSYYKDSKDYRYITFIKNGNKWKETVFSPSNPKLFTQICHKKDCAYYWEGDDYATITDVENIAGYNKYDMASLSMSYPLLKWGQYYSFPAFTVWPRREIEGKIINKNDKRNGFDCSLIEIFDDMEICVSHEYGIAIYIQSFGDYSYEFNVKEILTDGVYDSNFDFPEGMEKIQE